MGDKNVFEDFHVSRLDFLRYSLATSVAVWAGSQVSGMDEAEAQQLFGSTAVNPGLFPQSVAAGDPKPNGIVLWTRANAKASGTLRVGYRVALDDGRSDADAFASPVLTGVAETSAARDYTVKVQLQRAELKPFKKYRYRFYYNGSVSRTGRFKTLPAPNANVSRVRFGYISCQDYTNGYYNALGYLANEDVDFVVHLGDYIYETVSRDDFQGGGPEDRQLEGALNSGTPGEADNLADYRFLYKKYKTDRNLQRVHENFAMITIWDDHEFANDGYQTFAPDSADDPRDPDPRRREAANQAWAEYIPAGIFYNPSKSPLEEIVIYRSFAFGNLMELVMTDERLYRDGPPCGFDTFQRVFTPGCGAEEAPGRTMLGQSQKQFFLQKMTLSPRTWKIWGNETMFMQFKVANTYLGAVTDNPSTVFPTIPQAPGGPEDGVYVNLDQWDGYQAERNEITQRILNANNGRGVENFVIITGDIHSYAAGYVRENYDDPTPPVPGVENPLNRLAGTCFVCGSITSSNLVELALGAGRGGVPEFPPVAGLDPGEPSQDALNALETALQEQSNPHFEFFNSDTHGYNIMEVTPEKLTCTMKNVTTTQSRQSQLQTLARFEVPAGEVRITRTDLPVTAP